MTESHLVWIIDFDTLLSRHQADEMIKITLVDTQSHRYLADIWDIFWPKLIMMRV